MAQPQRADSLARVAVENVGGIDETTVELAPGVTVLAGENATNRTSFLQSIRAVLGSEDASLKGDADAGRVTMDLDGETHERELHRRGDVVAFDGDPYLDDPTLADLFAFLLGDNEARRAVARGGDLRELIMRPVDVEEIRAEINTLERTKEELSDELAGISEDKRELASAEQRRTDLRAEIEERREELAAVEADIEAADVDIEQGKAEKERLEERLEALSDARSELERVREDVDAVEESIDALRQELSDLEDERESVAQGPTAEGLDDDIAALRRTKSDLEAEIGDLGHAIEFNEEMLEGEAGSVLEDDDSDPTAELVQSELVCWTCGSSVTADAIESTLSTLRERRQSKLTEVEEVEADIEALQEEKREIEQAREREAEIDERIATVEAELDERQENLESLREERAELTEEVADLEAAVEEAEAPAIDDVLERHRAANELEFEIERRERQLEEIGEEIEALEESIAREDDLRERREEVQADLEDCRTRIDRVQTEAVDAFNTHMEAILEALSYDNIERIWIERREQTDGRRSEDAVFELHVVRSTESGTVYEDTVDHLSESEREVTGLVFALAGYLVHDVHETVPFMLLDSLEAIDADRIAALVDYFADYAAYLVVALLPEDAQALDASYDRVTEI